MTIADRDSPPDANTMRSASDYVFTFSYESFADAQKRGMMRPPDRLVSTLMNSNDVRRLLVADPYRSWLTGWLRALVDSPYRARETEKFRHLSPKRFARADPTEIDAVIPAYEEYERIVRAASARAGLVEPAFVTASPLVAGFSNLEWTSGALYYARDDWLSSPARRRYWPAYREAYQRIAASGRAVAAVSQEIIDRIAPTGPSRVVPNGIEPREWLGELPEAPAWFARIPGPRAAYLGTLDSRLDIDGIVSLSRARPDLHIVLIGPVPDHGYIRALRAAPNIHIRGEVRRAEVVAVLRNTELTLLAHRRTPLTEAMSPLKVYEYLAAGKPVLATDLRPVRGLGDRVLLADSVEQFTDLVDIALGSGSQDEAQRTEYVRANAWSSRHRQILALLGE